MKWKKGDFDNNKLLLILSSASPSSINGIILEQLSDLLNQEKIVFDYLNLLSFSDVPILLQRSEIPASIKEILKIIIPCRYLIIFAPEHNGYFSAFFKNILDWLSLLDKEFLREKKVILVSVSETKKTKRLMETGAINSLMTLGAETVKFVNFNEFYSKELSSRVKDLLLEVFHFFS